MYTNFLTTILYVIFTMICHARVSVPTGMIMATFLFGCLRGQVFTGANCGMCFGIPAVILFGFILLPENLIKRKKDQSAGYYERFL